MFLDGIGPGSFDDRWRRRGLTRWRAVWSGWRSASRGSACTRSQLLHGGGDLEDGQQISATHFPTRSLGVDVDLR